MWNSDSIDDLTIMPPEVRKPGGYALNIRSSLMADDLKPFVVTPSSPARRWADDVGTVAPPLASEDTGRPGKLDFSGMSTWKPVFETVFLLFPNREAALATSLGRYWVEQTAPEVSPDEDPA
jgi:hypothetical protein